MRQSIGSERNPVLFTAIRARLRKALYALVEEVVDTLDKDINNILDQIGSNLEMLRGSEAKVLVASICFCWCDLGSTCQHEADGAPELAGVAAMLSS